MNGRVLIIDDDLESCLMIQAMLTRQGHECLYRTSPAEGLELIKEEPLDAVITDLRMQGLDGFQLCQRIGSNRPDLPVVVITAFGSLQTAVAAMRAGAYDFLCKPFEREELLITVGRAVEHRQLQAQVRRLEQVVREARSFEEIIGVSPAMGAVFDIVERLEGSDATVLITGETGTGKDLVARALHRRSRRREGPFVALNCAAVPEALLESQLFGHTRGAYTDAREARTGLLVQASGGTVFLDEIGDLPLALQPKLLRALQERTVRPLGGEQEVPFDVRLVAATNRDLEEAVEQGSFRADLYYRLNVVQLALPPLRSRGGDVLLLARHFLEHFAARTGKAVCRLAPEAARCLMAYNWPGNVRELMNCVERAVALTGFDCLGVDDLPEKIRTYRSSHVVVAGEDPTELVSLDEVEGRYIARVMQVVGGNKALAARVLGLDRKTLYRKLERHHL